MSWERCEENILPLKLVEFGDDAPASKSAFCLVAGNPRIPLLFVTPKISYMKDANLP